MDRTHADTIARGDARREHGRSASFPGNAGSLSAESMLLSADLPCVERRSARPPRDTVAVGIAISAALHGLVLAVATSLHAAETLPRERAAPRTMSRDALMVVLHEPQRPSATTLATHSTKPTGGHDQPPPHRRGHRPTVAKVPSKPASTSHPLPATPPSTVADQPTLRRNPAPISVAPGPHGEGALAGGTAAEGPQCCGPGTGAGPGGGTALTSRSPARPIDSPRPIYPRQARLMGWEGTVVLRVFVDADGRAAEVDVVSGSGHTLLDESALDAARRWRFLPALENGHPIAMAHEVRIRFRLDDQAG